MDAGCENSHEKKLKIIDKMNPESEGTEPTTKINCRRTITSSITGNCKLLVLKN